MHLGSNYSYELRNRSSRLLLFLPKWPLNNLMNHFRLEPNERNIAAKASKSQLERTSDDWKSTSELLKKRVAIWYRDIQGEELLRNE